MLDMASVTSLLPYLLVAGYGVLLARNAAAYADAPAQARRDAWIAGAAVLYVLVMFAAAWATSPSSPRPSLPAFPVRRSLIRPPLPPS